MGKIKENNEKGWIRTSEASLASEYQSTNGKWLIRNLHPHYKFGVNWKLYARTTTADAEDRILHYIGSYPTLSAAKAATESPGDVVGWVREQAGE